ncbi:glycine zipper 2TM domain-containing protein [Ramlibacter tataouinensis]|nr:glycine zipper 2TM domain-containing protein [Ramlibacter tataouinensis]
MNADLTHPTAPQSSLRAVPRAVWVALGALSLATAGLTGALVMRAIDAPAAVPQVASAVEAQAAPAPATAAAAVSQFQPAAVPQAPVAVAPQPVAQAPAPVRVARPAPARPVQAAPAPVVARAPAQPAWNPPLETTRAAVCASCGTVETVQAVREQGQGSGLGAVGGAVIGGLLGNQVGGGNGRKVMTVVGAAGGALAGHQLEKRVRGTSAYDVQVRMEDGSVRTYRQAEPMAVGTRVVAEGQVLRAAQGRAAPAAPRPIYTTQSVGYGG